MMTSVYLIVNKQIMWFRREASKKFEAEFRGTIGSGSEGKTQITYLNRTAKLFNAGIEYEAASRHAELVIEQAGPESGSKPLSTPHGDKE